DNLSQSYLMKYGRVLMTQGNNLTKAGNRATTSTGGGEMGWSSLS
ncbi:6452_t:CDS:1, partial [Racocetra persica]